MNDPYRVSGRIFDIQRYSVHDGPGIRTILFLKGCRLRCRWCCNPESQEYDIQSMTLGGKTKTVGRDVTVGEILPELLCDRPYFDRSGGGITLSGGETLCQPEFAAAVFRACKLNGLDTAIETAAMAPRTAIEGLIGDVDHVLLDIKHMNSEKHRAFTGQPNGLILENAEYLSRTARDLVIRVPVIPTFNDTPTEISEIARFAASLPGVRALHLLPYHHLGQDKYAGLGREYTLSGLETPTSERMSYLLEVASETGLPCRIGG